MGRVIILDVESTGTQNHPKLGHPQPIEVAWIDITNSIDILDETTATLSVDGKIPRELMYQEQFKPSMPIHPEATKIHGKKYTDLLSFRPSESFRFPSNIRYMVGHNITYDHRCLGKPDVKLICTMKLAKDLNKNLKIGWANVQLDNLVAELIPDRARELITETHNALDDCIKNILVLQKLLEFIPAIDSWDKLYQFQQSLTKTPKAKKAKA